MNKLKTGYPCNLKHWLKPYVFFHHYLSINAIKIPKTTECHFILGFIQTDAGPFYISTRLIIECNTYSMVYLSSFNCSLNVKIK